MKKGNNDKVPGKTNQSIGFQAEHGDFLTEIIIKWCLSKAKRE